MSDQPDRTSPDRREFLKMLGAAGVASTLGAPAVALAQNAKGDARDAGAPKPETVTPAADEEPEISADARSMLEVVKRRYGRHLTDEQLQDILEELNWRVAAGEALRKVPFKNGDEPDFIFTA